MRYFDEAREIWRTSVPSTGQADTMQGELLRSVEKLRREAQSNGNQNWDANFEKLLSFLKENLTDPSVLPPEEVTIVVGDLERLSDHIHPETGDGLYDRLSDAVVLWARTHPEPLPHRHDVSLRR